MRVKDNTVEVHRLSTGILFALQGANEVYKNHGVDMVITSGHEQGGHSLTSFHHSGNAVDLRTHTFASQAIAAEACQEIYDRLGIDFDVILESDHIHIECQPRRRS